MAKKKGSSDSAAVLASAMAKKKGTSKEKKESDSTRRGRTGSYAWALQAAALATLSVQHCLVGIITRQSRTTSAGDFLPQTGVICQEILKGVVSLVLLSAGGERVGSAVFGSPRELARASVPALLYLVQNNLQYVALAYLDPATYVVTYQLKILSTALMSVLLLNTEISGQKWLALCELVAGVSIVQLSVMSGSQDESAANKNSGLSQQLLGLIAVLTTCLLSGLAGVYTEKILKASTVSLWARNVQLSIFSIIMGVIGLAVTDDMAAVREVGFFHGYNAWVCASVVNNSFGGLLIAVIIKYADNIIKNFATAISIILTTALSTYALGLTFTYTYFLGVAAVCCATFLYAGTFNALIQRIVASTSSKKSA